MIGSCDLGYSRRSFRGPGRTIPVISGGPPLIVSGPGKARRHPVREARTEYLRGYRLLEPLSAGGPGELWKTTAPAGRVKVARFITGSVRDKALLQHLRQMTHAAVVAIDRIEYVQDELVIIRELCERTLETVLAEYRAAGRPALPRAEALFYLRDIADALDQLATRFGLQHLAVRPAAIAVVENRARLLDYGIAHCLAQRSGGPLQALALGAFAAPHAAPELLQGKIRLVCDQYSLAVTYFELTTGTTPVPGDWPELRTLPEQDRAATARALDPTPTHRFASCGEFMHALLTADTHPGLCKSAGDTSYPSTQTESAAACADSSPPVASSQATAAGVSPSHRTANESGGIPGYRLVECHFRSSVTEVWNAETESGSPRLVRLLFGVNSAEPKSSTALDRLRGLNHDVLAGTSYFAEAGTRLAVISEPGKLSLQARYRRSHTDGLPGIPRHELINCLRQIAEGLDSLAASSTLQHLSLTPRQIFLGNGQPQVIDFGLAESFWLPAGQQSIGLTPRYAAPEVLAGKVTPAADQYSLAIIYQEMLAGYHPFRQLTTAELLAPRRPDPDLSMLPAMDRRFVSRALHLDPDKRFKSCASFLAALETGKHASWPSRPVVKPLAAAPRVPQVVTNGSKLTPSQILNELVQAAGGALELREFHGIRYVLRRGEAIEHRCFAQVRPEQAIEHHGFARLLPGTAWLKLDGFREHWGAAASAVEADHFRFLVKSKASVWERLMGREPGLEVHVRLHRPEAGTTGLTELAIDIFPIDCKPEHGARLLEELGPPVLESVRHYLQAHKDRRSQERLPFEQFVEISPVFPNLTRGTAIGAQARDISLHGMGLILANEPLTNHVAIRLATGAEGIVMPGEIVRADLVSAGQFDVGINFAIRAAPRAVRVEKVYA